MRLFTIRSDPGMIHHCFQLDSSPISVLKIEPDEHSFIAGSWNRTLYQCDLNSGTVKRQFSCAYHPSQIVQVAWDPQNPRLFASCSIDGTCNLWDVNAEAPVSTLSLSKNASWALDICFSKTRSGTLFVARKNGSSPLAFNI